MRIIVPVLASLAVLASPAPPVHAWGWDYAVPADAESSGVVSLARRPEVLDVFWIRSDGAVMNSTWSEANPRWEAWVVAPPGSAQPGKLAGGLAAIARNPDHLDVFWIRPEGGVSTSWWHAGTPHWNWAAPRSIAPARDALPGALTVAARNPDQLDVFWIGPDRAIRTAAWNPWRDWLPPWSITGPGVAHYPGGALSVVSRTRDQLDLFWVRPDGGVTTAWWNAAANWPWRPIAPAGHVLIGSSREPRRSALTAIARRPDQLDVFWIGPDGGIGTTAWNPHRDWPAPWPIAWPGAAAPGAIAAASRSPGQLDLAWISNEGFVQQLGFDERLTGGWAGLTATGPGKAVPGAVGLVGRRVHHLDAFWVRPDRAIGTNWWTRSGSACT